MKTGGLEANTLLMSSSLQRSQAPRCLHSVTVQGESISLGDTIRVIDKTDVSIATVLQIRERKGELILMVRPFYFAKDLSIKADCFGKAEIFGSEVVKEVALTSSIEKVIVLSVEEYISLDIVDQATYFTRASYDGSRFHPPISEWRAMCACQRVIIPDEPIIQCGNCLSMFHSKCMMPPFSCPDCLA
jgi:hypothetical protein